jgi:penicillin-binding protein 1A
MLRRMASRTLSERSNRGRVRVLSAPVRRPKRFRWIRRLLKLTLLLTIGLALLWAGFMHFYAPGLKQEAATIPERVASQLTQHGASYVPIAHVSPNLQHAIVAIEDRRFYQHPGVDPLGMSRAIWVNLTQHHVDQGGSTLEEQLVKRAIVFDDRSLRSKLREMALAWAVDQEFPKNKVLELYLNAAYFGQGAYGPAAAARVYFGVGAGNLSVAQAAFLAALPQAPSVFGANPNAVAVHQRWLTVLQDMEQQGYISARDEGQAAATRLRFALPA